MQSEDPMYKMLCNYTKALTVALGYRDPMTQLHSERVRYLSEELGQACGLTDDEIVILKIAASFHDIGKIGIPDPVLLKPGSFDEAEWEVMREHPRIGAEIIQAIELTGAKQAAEVIRCHHEHYDGSGYPAGQVGDDISILARIISIADAYDAMAMTRSYHQPKSHGHIMAIIHQETGTKFDPDIVAIFGGLIETSEYRAKG
ncbi:MAG: HD-GYP domain-containing protein [Gammaproteobacteria bacterium]|nr:HD-GYP domain-containing protein [Gammaproteobacteria bacterium]